MTQNNPKISVILPVYNVEKYLSECLVSIQNQTFRDFEVICVNDGSTDSSGDILNNFAPHDRRFKVICQENQGLSGARNTALNLVKGEYVTFIDSDDYVFPNFLETLYNTLQNTNADIAICDIFIDKMTKPTSTSLYSTTLYTNPLRDYALHHTQFNYSVWNKLYKRSLIGETRFPNILYEDWIFNLLIFDKAKNVAFVNEKLYFYRMSTISIMRSSFNEKKLNSYISGILSAYHHFMKNNPQRWEMIQKTVISNIVNSIIKRIFLTKDKVLIYKTAHEFQNLRKNNIISYKNLSISKKVKLFYLLHLPVSKN